MENRDRDRDKVSRDSGSTAAGDINGETEHRKNLEEPNERSRDIETDRSGDSKGRH